VSVHDVPATACAAVLQEWGGPLELREYPLSPPEPGALLIEVDCATICGTDVHLWQGALSAELPIILGHEIVGRVAAVGDGSELDSVGAPVQVGDRVLWEHEACGRCYSCTVLRDATVCPNRRYGFRMSAERAPHFHGGFAQYTYVRPKAGRIRVPDEVKSEWAAAASCAMRTVVAAIERLGRVDFNHDVVIQGSGPLGLFATAILSVHEPRTLVVVGAPDARLEVARAWGADLTISIEEHPDAERRRELVLDVTGGRGADVVLELSGARTAFAEGLQLAAPGGRYVVVGTIGGPEQPVPAHLITAKALSVYGSLSAEIGAYYKALDFLRRYRDRFDWDLMIGGRYPLERAGEALERMRTFEEIKAVVVPAPARSE
jgi:threonine dehydrogenase-like Zn-dependent dehydrogenase